MSELARIAVERSMRRRKHSPFYYRLTELTQKISLFKEMFYSKMPKHEEIHLSNKRRRHLQQILHKARQLEAVRDSSKDQGKYKKKYLAPNKTATSSRNITIAAGQQ